MSKIDLNKIRYLSFEGGGGKGTVYLGAVRALEKKFGKVKGNKTEPIIDINSGLNDNVKRPIKGVSGASAGAITAFMLSLGMTSREIENEINKTQFVVFKRTFLNGILRYTPFGFLFGYKKIKVSQFELFFDRPNGKLMKAVTERANTIEYDNYYNSGKAALLLSLSLFFNTFIKGVLSLIIKTAKTVSKQSMIFERFFDSDQDSVEYTYSVLFNRGMFVGTTTRTYFASLIENYLYEKVDWKTILKPYLPRRELNPDTGFVTTVPSLILLAQDDILRKIIINFDSIIENPDLRPVFKPADKLTFLELLYLTGVDLVITGTNLTTNRSLYLSTYHTPDFPVADAVSISMNLPIIFKPVYVDYLVHKGQSNSYNELYKGLWVDGGMLNNFPIHAFDDLEEIKDFGTFRGINYTDFKISKTKANSTKPFCDCVLGFRLKSAPELKDPKKEDMFVLSSYLGSIINTFMFPGGDGQIRSQQEEDSTIYLNTYAENREGGYKDAGRFIEISVTDFASPDLDEERGNKIMAELKKILIKEAEDITYGKIH